MSIYEMPNTEREKTKQTRTPDRGADQPHGLPYQQWWELPRIRMEMRDPEWAPLRNRPLSSLFTNSKKARLELARFRDEALEDTNAGRRWLGRHAMLRRKMEQLEGKQTEGTTEAAVVEAWDSPQFRSWARKNQKFMEWARRTKMEAIIAREPVRKTLEDMVAMWYQETPRGQAHMNRYYPGVRRQIEEDQLRKAA